MKMQPVAILFAVIPLSIQAQENAPVAKDGDLVIIRLTGELAKDYARMVGRLPEGRSLDGLEVELAAAVDTVLPDGTLRIESSLTIRDAKPIRLITLSGKVDPRRITTDTTPKGTIVNSSPEGEPTLTTEDYKNRRLELNDLKGFKLRSWTLAEELGE